MTSTNTEFSGSRMKILRAEQHINDLKTAVSDFREMPACTIAGKQDASTGQTRIYIDSVQPIPEGVALCLEDAINNMRVALDRAMFTLWKANGCVGENPSIPTFRIFADADEYATHRDGLKRLFGETVVKALDAIKPYRTEYEVLWALNKLNNIAKHRQIPTLAARSPGLDLNDFFRAQTGIDRLPFSATSPVDMSGTMVPLEAGEVLKVFPMPLSAKAYEHIKVITHILIDEADIPASVSVEMFCEKAIGAVKWCIRQLE